MEGNELQRLSNYFIIGIIGKLQLHLVQGYKCGISSVE